MRRKKKRKKDFSWLTSRVSCQKCFRELEPHILLKASSKPFRYYYLASLTSVPDVEIIIEGKITI